MPDSCCPGLCLYGIPSEKENPERRNLWICAIKRASVPEEGKQWQPSKYTRICSEHFIKGAKSDDPLSPDWVQSVFSHTPATKKRKREKDMERYEQHNRMKNKRVEKMQDAVDDLLELSSVPDAELAPPAEDEQQCDNRQSKEKFERLQRECNDLREENQKLKDKIKSGTFDELAFEKDDEKVKAMTGIPTYSKLQVVLTFVISFLQTGTNLSPFQQLLLTLMRLRINLSLSLLSCIFKISIPTGSRTFRNTIEVLNARLVPALVFWPNREELLPITSMVAFVLINNSDF
uniref:THAP domain-containing protein 1-like n=1 Tax=Sinocyclocheilus anshuiensis TaxID=1608454 RepID=A0A671R4M2_9TELE